MGGIDVFDFVFPAKVPPQDTCPQLAFKTVSAQVHQGAQSLGARLPDGHRANLNILNTNESTEARLREMEAEIAMLRASEHEHKQEIDRLRRASTDTRGNHIVTHVLHRHMTEACLETHQNVSNDTGDPKRQEHAQAQSGSGTVGFSQHRPHLRQISVQVNKGVHASGQPLGLPRALSRHGPHADIVHVADLPSVLCLSDGAGDTNIHADIVHAMVHSPSVSTAAEETSAALVMGQASESIIAEGTSTITGASEPRVKCDAASKDAQSAMSSTNLQNSDNFKCGSKDKAMNEDVNPHTLTSRSVEGLQTESIVERHVNPNRLKLKGVMRKKGQINTAWKDRFFALTEGGVCSYYDNENKFLAQGSVANGSFSCEGLIVESGGQSKEGFLFNIFIPGKDAGPVTTLFQTRSVFPSSRTIECACKSFEERNAWVDALRAAASRFIVPHQPSTQTLLSPVKLWEGPDDDFKRQPGETFDITLTRNARGNPGFGCSREHIPDLMSESVYFALFIIDHTVCSRRLFSTCKQEQACSRLACVHSNETRPTFGDLSPSCREIRASALFEDNHVDLNVW